MVLHAFGAPTVWSSRSKYSSAFVPNDAATRTTAHGFSSSSTTTLRQRTNRNRVDFVSLNAVASRGGGGSRGRRNGHGGTGGGGSPQSLRSKRQERVAQLVRTELSRIIHSGNVKGDVQGYIEAELRQRISVVSADVSPDLRQARIAVSIRTPKKKTPTITSQPQSEPQSQPERTIMASPQETTESALPSDIHWQEEETPLSSPSASPSASSASSVMLDKRRAYSWLVKNTKPIRHTLAQRMSHLKTCPNLSFTQVDVAAAVDVMYLIDQISSSNQGGTLKRDTIDWWDGAPANLLQDDDEDDYGEYDDEVLENETNRRTKNSLQDDDDDDEDWIEDDRGFFK